MFYPELNASIEASVKSEALLIRTKFSYAASTRSNFEANWNNPNGKESVSANWKYNVKHYVDTPRFTDIAWREYVMGTRPVMPDIGSSNALPVCYSSRKSITLNNGTRAWVNGQVCYIGGEYVWSE